MYSSTGKTVRPLLTVLLGLALLGIASAAEEEPPALNPFGPVKHEREDAVPGYLEMSDGTIWVGNIYMTRDKRLKIEDRSSGGGDDVRQREVPLRVVKQIECSVQKEWLEKEWRFKETTVDEKLYTGRTYPSRIYTHTITLKDDRTITGPLAEIIYVQPFASREGPRTETPEPQRFLLHKRDKGEVGTDLDSLRYVRLIKLGPDAVEEGKQKAAKEQGKAKGARKGPAKKSGKGK